MASLVLVIVMSTVAFVLTNSLADAAFARQREAATNLAATVLEDVKIEPWAALSLGLSTLDPTLSADKNITPMGGPPECYQGSPLDIDGKLAVVPGTCPTSNPWFDPSCLKLASSNVGISPFTVNSNGLLGQHEFCTTVNKSLYAIDIYPTENTGTTRTVTPPLTVSVVVTWANPARRGLLDHVVSTTQISQCQVNALCSS